MSERGHESHNNKSRGQFARELIIVLDSTLYKLLSVPEAQYKSYERTLSELARQKGEKERRTSREAVANVLVVLEQLLFSGLLNQDTKRFLGEKVRGIRKSVTRKGYPSKHDVKNAVTLATKTLNKLYPGKSVHEVRNLVQPKKGDEQDAGKETETDKEELKKICISKLYDAYYLNGYYPGVPSLLEFTGDKKKDQKIIHAHKKLLDTFISEGRRREDVIEDIRNNIGSGTATRLEEVFFLILTNKARGNWAGGVQPYIDTLVDLGEDMPEEFSEKIQQYAEDIKRKTRTDFDLFTEEDYRIMVEEGFRAEDEAVEEKVSEDDIRHVNKLIEMTIARAYPEAVEEIGGGHHVLNRRTLERLLGKEPLPAKFIEFMKENDPMYPG